MINLPAHALAHAIDAADVLIADDVLAVRGQADVPVAVGRHRAVGRVRVGPGGHVLPVVDIHRRLRAVAHQHVAPAGVEPIERAAEIFDRRAARGSEIDSVRKRAAALERDLVDAGAREVIVDIGIDRVESRVGGVAVRHPAVFHGVGDEIHDFPIVPVARLVGVPPHIAGVEVVERAVGRDAFDRRAEDGIGVARAHTKRGHKIVVGKGPGRRRRMEERVE